MPAESEQSLDKHHVAYLKLGFPKCSPVGTLKVLGGRVGAVQTKNDEPPPVLRVEEYMHRTNGGRGGPAEPKQGVESQVVGTCQHTYSRRCAVEALLDGTLVGWSVLDVCPCLEAR